MGQEGRGGSPSHRWQRWEARSLSLARAVLARTAAGKSREPACPSRLPLDSSLLAWVISVFTFSPAHLGCRHLPCTLEAKEFSRPLKPLHGSPVPTGERPDLSRADVPSAVWGPQTSQSLFLAHLPSTFLSGQPEPFAAS